VNGIREQTKILRIYFNNHYGGKAVVNAMQFKVMNGISLSADERKVLENTKTHINFVTMLKLKAKLLVPM
jgi:hypothetical protein